MKLSGNRKQRVILNVYQRNVIDETLIASRSGNVQWSDIPIP